MGVIYKITNKINGKIYIGKCGKDNDNFLKSNYYGSGTIITDAIKKYGVENFDREIIEEVHNSDRKLENEREIYWIDKLDARNPEIGYNITKGGDGGDIFSGNPRREEIGKKISIKVKGVPKSKEHAKHISEATMGDKNHTKITLKNKIYEEIYGIERAIEQKEKRSKALEKAVYSKRRNKTNEEIYGIERAAEIKENQSKKMMNHKVSNETKKKIGLSNSINTKKYWCNQSEKEKKNRAKLMHTKKAIEKANLKRKIKRDARSEEEKKEIQRKRVATLKRNKAIKLSKNKL